MQDFKLLPFANHSDSLLKSVIVNIPANSLSKQQMLFNNVTFTNNNMTAEDTKQPRNWSILTVTKETSTERTVHSSHIVINTADR